MAPQNSSPIDYDSVELRGGRLIKLRRADARLMGDDDRVAPVAKCYCRSHDVITPEEAQLQRRPTFVFPEQFFPELESLIGKELEGRIYSDNNRRRVRFHLDLREHAGFQLDDGNRGLFSPWYDENVLKE